MSVSVSQNVPTRSRIVLTIDGGWFKDSNSPQQWDDQFTTILNAGDIASIIFSPGPLDENQLQNAIAPLVPLAQSADIAVIVATDTRTAGRVGADGLQLGQDLEEAREAIEKFTPKMMIGLANVKSRHNALVLGELQPDYVMFGKPGGDIRPQAHPKNLDLAAWWSSMVEIPCIVLGGNSIDSVVDCAKSGADFIALGSAIFLSEDGSLNLEDAADNLRQANILLDTHAPQFDFADA